MTPEQISALKAAAEKATPGPWAYIFAGKNEMRKFRCADGSPVTPIASISHRVPGGLVSAVCAASIDGDFVRFSETSLSWPECDSEYIALANPAAILALVGEMERLQAVEQAYKSAVQEVRDMYPEFNFPPDGKSQDSLSAKMARLTCDNISRRAAEIVEAWNLGWEPEDAIRAMRSRF